MDLTTSQPQPSNDLRVTYLRPSKGWRAVDLRELWEYRELLYFLTWRNVKVRYKQTILGAAWAILQPVFTMLIFYVVFNRIAKMPSDGVPYPIFSYTGLVLWTFFSTGILLSSNSLIFSGNLLTKVYFPRLAIPIATVVSGLIDLLLAFLLLVGMMAYYHIFPTVKIFALPLIVLLALMISLGVGLWLAGLNVQFRDVNYLVPFLTQAWLFISPVAYPASQIPEKWRLLYALNPMTGVIEGFRWALLPVNHGLGSMFWISCLLSTLLLISGAFYFRRLERHFADVV